MGRRPWDPLMLSGATLLLGLAALISCPVWGESAIESIGRVEKLLSTAAVIEISDASKLRAAERAMAKKAPFHTQRNSMADAVLETYADLVR
jgi:hypothetical protein